MRAIGVIPGKRELTLLDHPDPGIGSDGEVLVKSLDVGVCGTDREICSFVYGTPPEGDDYLVLGHESLGEVVDVAESDGPLRPGDFVVASVRRPCVESDCRPCRQGLQDFCVNGNFTERGIKEAHGYMTEYYVEEAKYLFKVPTELRDVAVLTEPLTIAEKALIQVAKVQNRLPWGEGADGSFSGKGLRAIVLGAGPIGILGAMALKVRGFDTVVYSRSKAPNPKAELVESLGVPYVSALEMTPEQLVAEHGKIDFVYEAVGIPSISFEVLKALGDNGAFVFTGIPASGAPEPVYAADIMRNMVLKNQLVLGTVNADPQSFRNALADLGRFNKRWPESLRRIISERHAPDAYRSLLLDKATGIKNVIQFH